jgi:8-oxo-dGTP pyrophosphatase MutT (NUDIX family)
MTFRITNVETIHAGRSKFLILTVRLPDGQTMRREVEDHGAAVCVLPYDPARRTAILVRQFRAPVFLAAQQEELLEAIAGIVESDRKSAGGARRGRKRA